MRVEVRIAFMRKLFPEPEAPHMNELKFRFSRENYESVVNEIKRQAKEYKEAKENK